MNATTGNDTRYNLTQESSSCLSSNVDDIMGANQSVLLGGTVDRNSLQHNDHGDNDSLLSPRISVQVSGNHFVDDFVIARKLLRRRHIMKDRRERLEEIERTTLERKRQQRFEEIVESDISSRDCQKRTKSRRCACSSERTTRHNLSSSNCGERDVLNLCADKSLTAY